MKSELEELRAKIDVLDDEIVSRLKARFKLVEQIGKLKHLNDMPILDAAREATILSRFDDDDIREIYKLVMSVSRQRQY